MTARLLTPEIDAFAAAVRRALGDLPPDTIDDLTDGLEADLVESAFDDGELGDPAAYAEELRTAAGLPRQPVTPAPAFARVRRMVGSVAAEWRGILGRHPLLASFAAFWVSLRPVWWVFRGFVAGLLIVESQNWGAPINGFTAVGFAATILLSVQFGRGRWMPFGWMRGLLLIVNLALVIATPFLLAGGASLINQAASWSSYQVVVDDQGQGVPPGVDQRISGLSFAG